MYKPTPAIATVLLGTSLGLAAASAQAMEETSFTYVGSWSSLSLYQNFERPFWEDHLPAASDGMITTEVTTFDQMGLSGG